MEVLINLGEKEDVKDLEVVASKKDNHKWTDDDLKAGLVLKVEDDLLSKKVKKKKKTDDGKEVIEEKVVVSSSKLILNERATGFTKGQWANLRNPSILIKPFRNKIYGKEAFIEVK